ncbi:hypothetical protein [Pinirhizobacter sp.]|jgi:hypothetical protein|uniref:hypothetical protein n=1 Tax=Pinirhizobacter sp. TaxID=2950432 RepID=UPI002F3E6779
MTSKALPTDKPAQPSCPVCHGTGEVVVIDEEVGCHVPMPCWACQDGPMPPEGYDRRPIKDGP